MRLSIVVPVWNRADRVRVALDSASRAVADLGLEAELIVVDDASEDDAAEVVAREHPAARLLRNEVNRGFAVTANRGLAAATGDLLLLLNSDTELGSEALAGLVRALEAEPQLDLVAPRLVDGAGGTLHSCMAFPRRATALWFGSPLERWFPRARELRRYRLDDFDHHSRREDLQPPAACWLLRRAAWERIGPFDEGLELFFNDVDWCRRLVGAGGRLAYLPEPTVVHHEGSSTSLRSDFVPRWHLDRLRYHRKHHGRGTAALLKLVVTWTYLDWLVRNGLRRLGGGDAEPTAPLSRALASFLRS